MSKTATSGRFSWTDWRARNLPPQGEPRCLPSRSPTPRSEPPTSSSALFPSFSLTDLLISAPGPPLCPLSPVPLASALGSAKCGSKAKHFPVLSHQLCPGLPITPSWKDPTAVRERPHHCPRGTPPSWRDPPALERPHCLGETPLTWLCPTVGFLHTGFRATTFCCEKDPE